MARPIYTHFTSFTGVLPSMTRSAWTDAPIAMQSASLAAARTSANVGALVTRCARC
jgi:hypothetical protein